jgi:hypothetical protein
MVKFQTQRPVNPFVIMTKQNQVNTYQSGLQVVMYFAPAVLGIIFLGVLVEKVKGCFGNCQCCCNRIPFYIVDMFKDVHFQTVGHPIIIQKTTFGAIMSVAFVVASFAAIAILAINNLRYVSYASSVTSLAPEWRPHGEFVLKVNLWGAALGNCSILSFEAETPSDWVGSISSTVELSTDNSSCFLQWECNQNCFLQAQQSRIVVRTDQPSWISVVSYSVLTPGFSESSQSGAGESFQVSGRFASPFKSISNLTALQGSDPTVVEVVLTPFVLQDQTGQTQKVALEPSVSTIQFGSVVSESSFTFDSESNSSGFSLNFDFTQNTITATFTENNISIINFLVLGGSLASSFLSIFAILTKRLESLFGMKSEKFNPTGKINGSVTPDPDFVLTPNSFSIPLLQHDY